MEEENHGPTCKCHQFLLSQNDDNVNHLIDFAGLRCLNSLGKVRGEDIFRAETDRHSTPSGAALQSFPGDPELVLIIRFKEEVRLRAVNFVAVAGQRPEHLGLYLNVENFAFADTRDPADQSFALDHFTPAHETEVYCDVKKASHTRSLVLFFRGRGAQVGLSYIGLKGFSTRSKPTVFRGEYELRNTAEEGGSAEELKVNTTVPF